MLRLFFWREYILSAMCTTTSENVKWVMTTLKKQQMTWHMYFFKYNYARLPRVRRR
jgi:hypothetical protein